jgi:hypothetical protein
LPVTPTSPVPTLTPTPDPTAEPVTPSGEQTDPQDKLQDGSGTDLDKGGQGGSENEDHSGAASSTQDTGTTVQEGSDGNTGLNNDPISTEEGNGESVNPVPGEPVHEDGVHEEHDSENHAINPSETQAPNPAPPPEHN